MNYSEFGTEVNGQLYSCDFSEVGIEKDEKPRSNKKKQDDCKTLLDNVINPSDSYNINRLPETKPKAYMAAPARPRCACSKRSPLDAGWEGTALLSHAVLIRFGCLAFAFSVVKPEKMVDFQNGQTK